MSRRPAITDSEGQGNSLRVVDLSSEEKGGKGSDKTEEQKSGSSEVQ